MQLDTRLRSTFMRVMASRRFQALRHGGARVRRRLSREAPRVHYFHELSDPYSHLAVQQLDALRARYALPFDVHLVSSAEDVYRGDAARYGTWAMEDAAAIAAGYGVSFPDSAVAPGASTTRAAERELAPLLAEDAFASRAVELGERLWQGLVEPSSTDALPEVVVQGNGLRARLGHYAGAMFYFDGEWYWGLDRLFHLEERLVEEGYGSGPILVPRPRPSQTVADAGDVTLEYFPSLRSPYTAISFARTMDLVDRTGIKLVTRPVMPMMMRGVAAPAAKASYIMFDAAREGRAADDEFGRIVDPFGEPVRRAFSLLPFLQANNKVREFTGRYLEAAWKQGVDITLNAGLERIVRECDLDWQQALASMDNDQWEPLLESNVSDMLALGLWGVPSFRVSSQHAAPFSAWGQDRLWRVEQAICDHHLASNASG